MTKRFGVFYMILFMVVSTTFFQNCGGSFKSQPLQEASTGNNVPPIDVPIDPLAPLSLYAQSVSVKQGSDIFLTVKINKAHSEAITVNLATVSGGVADTDFPPWAATASIPAGSTEAQVRMGAIVNKVYTQDRLFSWKIVSASAGLLAQQSAQITIRAAVQVLTGFDTLYNTYNQMCSISPGGVLKCMGSKSTKASGSVNWIYDRNLTVVNGIPGVRNVSRSCVLTVDDRVLCRGYNLAGQAGADPAVTDFVEQYTEINLGGAVDAMYDGWDSTCVLLKSGSVKCWGGGTAGQLGNGLSVNSHIPVQVSGLTAVKFISTASIARQYCAYQTDGKILCWGNSPHNDGNSSVPVLLAQQSGVRQIVGGYVGNFCLVMDTGKVFCIKDKSAAGTNFEERIELTNTARLVGSHNHTCALGTDHSVKCWGANMFGKLGYLAAHGAPVPVPVAVPKWQGAIDVVASLYNTCALMPDKSVLCAGDHINGTYFAANLDTPAQTVPGIENVVSATSFGYGGICAITSAGLSKCWKSLYTHLNFSLPIPHFAKINDEFVVAPIAAPTTKLDKLLYNINLTDINYATSGCFITDAGTVNCWGTNVDGELGNNSTTGSAVPVPVSGLTGVVKIKQNGSTRCALTQQKKLFCWGNNTGYTISRSLTGTFTSVPIEITLVSDVVDFDMTYLNMSAVLGNGTVKTWGEEAPASSIVYAEHTLPLTGVKKYNFRNHCATHLNNTVSCGKEFFPDGTIRFELVPGISEFIKLGNATCSITATRTIKCWGDNNYGQLGTGDRVKSDVPVDVKGVANATAVFSAFGVACASVDNAVTRVSNILCWGDTWDNRNPTLAIIEIEALRGAKPIIDEDGRAEAFIDASGRIRSTEPIRLSAVPFPLTIPR